MRKTMGKTMGIIKIISILLIMIQIINISFGLKNVNAEIKDGDVLTLKGDHECDSVVQYQMDNGWWSYKVVWYVYYIDSQTGNKYPAFCVEPAKEGVGTGYTQYDTLISKETDSGIWRILSKGYMGSSWQAWNLENDDDFYSATKIALHSYKENIAPKTKYRLGDRSVDGNTVEEIQRRGAKVLDVAQALYDYALSKSETYQGPKVTINQVEKSEIQIINDEEYLVQNYKVNSNKSLKSYKISIQNFVSGTKVLDSNNKEIQGSVSNPIFKIVIPTKNIKDVIKGKIIVNDASIKTCPIYYAKSSIDGAQSYVTYSSGYEITSTNNTLEVDPNTASIRLMKIDKENGKAISNVTFEVFDEQEQSLGQYETNEDGIIEINKLKPGLYRIKEVNVEDRYVMNEDTIDIELEYGKTNEITIENELKKGSLRIIKTDLNNQDIKLQGVEFELYDDKDNLVANLETDENGEAFIDNLYIGKYKLVETKTLDGYVLDNNAKNIIIEWNQETSINIHNKKIELPKLPRTGY